MTFTTDPDGVPVFGVDSDLTGTRPLRISMLHVPTGETRVEEFSAYVDPGFEPVFGVLRAGTDQGQQAGAYARIITKALVDDDGIPSSQVLNPDDPEDAAALADIPSWSSLRRFLHYVDSSDYRLSVDMLKDLAQWLAKGAMGRERPTSAPSPSSPGRTATRRGSTGKRSAKD